MTYAIVCGGRDLTDRDLVFHALDTLWKQGRFEAIVEGGQRTRDKKTGQLIGGADFWAHAWAVARGVPHFTEPADWDKWGKRAGPIRNLAMITKFDPKLVVAFPGGRGTADMIERAEEYGITALRIISA